MCRTHSFEFSDVEAIRTYVSDHGGALDLQLNRIQINAESLDEVWAPMEGLQENKRHLSVIWSTQTV